MSEPKTFSELLRKWDSAGALSAALAKHGCDASEVLIRRWWNEEMLPDRAWLPLVLAAEEAGLSGITLEVLATLAMTSREDRLARLPQRASA